MGSLKLPVPVDAPASRSQICRLPCAAASCKAATHLVNRGCSAEHPQPMPTKQHKQKRLRLKSTEAFAILVAGALSNDPPQVA